MALAAFDKIWFAPTFSSLIQNRREGLVIAGAGILQLGLHLAGLPGWACPFKALFGIPCPGCGLTTSVGQIFQGRLGDALHTHAFAPIFIAAFIVMAAVVLLPEKQRELAIARIAVFERRTGVTSLVLTGLMLYWVVRLAGLV